MHRRMQIALLDVLNDAAATLIALDADGARHLAKLDGKVFCVEISAPRVTLYCLPGEHGVAFCREADAPPDVTLCGSASALCGFVLRAATGKPFARGDKVAADNFADNVNADARVTIRGDVELAQEMQAILAQLDLDCEEWLAGKLGDVAARAIGQTVRDTARMFGDAFSLMRANCGDYLSEETHLVVGQTAMRRFANQVNELRANIDRIDKRIAQLHRAHSTPSD